LESFPFRIFHKPTRLSINGLPCGINLILQLIELDVKRLEPMEYQKQALKESGFPGRKKNQPARGRLISERRKR
jgi:hypothetical protein